MSSGYKPDAARSEISSNHEPSTEVYAVHGADPEVQAYGMAKYSRSALSLRESLAEINDQKAEKFLNTFYFQYGHRSIADLAHIAFAIERLSILAATVAVDEPRWDGQERSTRYQDFQKSGYYVPDFGQDAAALGLYRETLDQLFSEYRYFSEQMFHYLRERTPKPEEMKPEAYERTLRARAFDISRYLLPLATNTSLGQIVSARTLENQVSRLLSHTHAEVRRLGELLRRAAQEPAYNVGHDKARALLEEIHNDSSVAAERLADFLLRPVRVAPTLMKYAEPNAYEIETRRELTAAARELLGSLAVEPAPIVDLLDDDPLEIELAATLLYQYSHSSYRQIRRLVAALPEARRREIIELGLRHRGRHDEVARPFCSGQQFRFDILMDIGGFRDMHRHRRCVQIVQDYTTAHGYDEPVEIAAAGLGGRYEATMQRARETVAQLRDRTLPTLPPKDGERMGHPDVGEGTERPAEAEAQSQYVIPLAFRKRTLFKMDFAEALYISELRTGAAGHFSYRNVAFLMYEAVAQRYPALAQYFRVTDVREPVDLLKR
ncbi:MAG TPA: FAD-dependent thymidylate synthase [Terracidiphilus sp.]|nr:FAD-dependent thymidylate synthase [Terracidiphilus sp.]